MYIGAFIIWVLGSNLKVIIRNVISMCVKLSLVMLTICKSHFQTFSDILLLCITGMCHGIHVYI